MAALPLRKRPQERADDVPDGTMGFLDHLDELRTRIIRAAGALVVGMLVAFAFIDRIADFVLAPTLRVLPPGTTLIMTRFGEGLSFYMDLAFLVGVVLAAPFVTYQVWRFTLAGALFSHYVFAASVIEQASRRRRSDWR